MWTLIPESVIARSEGFAGGVNNRDAPNQLGLDEAIAIRNMILDERGGASKRRGSSTKIALAGRILSMFTFYRGSSDPQVILHLTDGTLRYTTDLVTVTTIASSLSTTAPFSYETFLSKCYMSNGVDNYCWWDGAAFGSSASAPKGKYLRLWKDTMWVSGVTGLEDRVYTSNPGDAETFPVAGWVDIAKGDGDKVNAMHTDGNVLIIWKQRRTFVIYDPVTLANRLVDYEKGCESHFSVISHEQRIYFLSRRGICVFLGDQPSQIISGNIDPVFTPQVLNLNALDKTVGYVFENRVTWAVPEVNQTVPTLQIEHYPRLPRGPFSFHRLPGGAFATLRKGSSEYLLYGKTSANKLMEGFTSGTDDGTLFNGVVETGWFDLGAPLNKKYLSSIRILGRGKFFVGIKKDFESSITKSYTVDLSSGSEVWDAAADTWDNGIWGPGEIFQEKEFRPDLYARYISFRFSDAETVEGSRIVDVGDTDYLMSAGQFAVYGIIIQGILMGANL